MEGSIPINEAIFEQVKHLASIAPEISGACLILHFEPREGFEGGETVNINVKPDSDLSQQEFIDRAVYWLGELRGQIEQQRDADMERLQDFANRPLDEEG